MVEPGIFFCFLFFFNCSIFVRFVYFLFNCPYCPIILRGVDFSIMKNPTASVGSEPAILENRTRDLMISSQNL
jgi:hypothetical protein